MTGPNWEPRRLTAVKAELPEGVTPPGTRGRILHAALLLFAERGFHGTSIRDLARVTEINSATLYAHYAAKEDILAELIALGHVELYNGMLTALSTAGPSARDRLVALVRAQVHMHADYPLLAVVANNEMHALSPQKAAPALSLREQARQLLYGVLRDGVAAGEFAIGDQVLAGIALGSIGIRVANWFGPDQPYTRDQVADTFAEYALRIVCALPIKESS
ncbi:TetR family transcriptional regulator [Rhizocola hellebori]|uniref:TetR family transcriptional regulator n=1 Tax=Rhizocola hellebori TaxID=1392758 RepID=A0A8J3VK89_9ACTN|nr:TetR/AcrR family transcriptional regulator [Rhizocola hellebori]GIH09490.1 TetR family transcriptional regulator [Rhizocola hellebori]